MWEYLAAGTAVSNWENQGIGNYQGAYKQADPLEHMPLKGPTQAELDKHEALNNAWEAYLITRKLIGVK